MSPEPLHPAKMELTRSRLSGTRNFIRMMGGTIALAACSAILNNSVQSGMRSAGVASSIITQVIADPTQIQSLQISQAEKDVALLGYSELPAWISSLPYETDVHQPTAFGTFSILWCPAPAFPSSSLSFVSKRVSQRRECIPRPKLTQNFHAESLRREDDEAMKQQGKAWAEKHKGRGKGHRGHRQHEEATSATSSTHEKDERTIGSGGRTIEKDNRA